MSKRSTDNLRSQQEIRIDQNRNYGYYIKDEKKAIGKVNPIFTERPHYGIPVPAKEAT